jgi:thiol-disulfide isomerase/thioredoxin
MKRPLPLLICLFLAVFTSSLKPKDLDLQGKWRASLSISPDEIPFGMGIFQEAGKWRLEVYNAEEILVFDEVEQSGDSLKVTMGIFDSEIHARILGPDSLEGVFIKNTAANYRVPFSAKKGESNRFPTKDKPSVDFSGRWKTTFRKANGEEYESVGIFSQSGNRLTGTFLTNLGDYRYLEGNVDGNSFKMSAFDGSHLFYFGGEISDAGEINGLFRSGPRGRETFTAVRDENFELPDAYSFNYLKDGYEKLTFRFPDVNGKTVSLDDPKFQGKVVLVQLFGTWCPNCMDETRFLAPWYDKHKDKGIEVIALAFEAKPDFAYASERVKKTVDKLGANYTFLIAGESNKEKASQALPALNQVIAFPTLIYIDKKGKVRKIHTGFTGPGTGDYYDRWIEEHEALVKKLLEE